MHDFAENRDHKQIDDEGNTLKKNFLFSDFVR